MILTFKLSNIHCFTQLKMFFFLLVMMGVSQLTVQDITESSATLIWTPPRVQYETYYITFTSQVSSQSLYLWQRRYFLSRICVSLPLLIRNITRNVIGRFWLHFQEISTVGPYTNGYISGVIWITVSILYISHKIIVLDGYWSGKPM